MIDTHSHVFLPQFAADLQQVEQRAKEAGVTQVLLPNVDLNSIGQLRQTLARDTDFYRGMMGLHPCSVDENWQEVLAQIEAEWQQNRTDYLAVGEIGLDLFWDQSTLEWQQQVLRIQFQWALEAEVPVSIHCRQAFDPLFEVLDEFKHLPLKGVLHCFTGDLEQAQRCLEYGLHLGIGGVVTYKNGGLDQVLPAIALEKLVVETDAPYLAPVPYRGKRNEPAYLIHISQKLAEIKGISLHLVQEVTTANARELYRL